MIWKHHPGYNEARTKVLAQTLEQDLATLDRLYGRGNLHGAMPAEVKAETLAQVERDWRSERNFDAELWVAIVSADRETR